MQMKNKKFDKTPLVNALLNNNNISSDGLKLSKPSFFTSIYNYFFNIFKILSSSLDENYVKTIKNKQQFLGETVVYSQANTDIKITILKTTARFKYTLFVTIFFLVVIQVCMIVIYFYFDTFLVTGKLSNWLTESIFYCILIFFFEFGLFLIWREPEIGLRSYFWWYLYRWYELFLVTDEVFEIMVKDIVLFIEYLRFLIELKLSDFYFFFLFFSKKYYLTLFFLFHYFSIRFYRHVVLRVFLLKYYFDNSNLRLLLSKFFVIFDYEGLSSPVPRYMYDYFKIEGFYFYFKKYLIIFLVKFGKFLVSIYFLFRIPLNYTLLSWSEVVVKDEKYFGKDRIGDVIKDKSLGKDFEKYLGLDEIEFDTEQYRKTIQEALRRLGEIDLKNQIIPDGTPIDDSEDGDERRKKTIDRIRKKLLKKLVESDKFSVRVAYYQAGRSVVEEIKRRTSKSEKIKHTKLFSEEESKKTKVLFNNDEVNLDNFTSIFYKIRYENVRRMYERCLRALNVKFLIIPTKYSFFLPTKFYKYFRPYVFFTKPGNFNSKKSFYSFFYNSFFNLFKFNTSNWYLNFIKIQFDNFFKFEDLRDQIFFFNTEESSLEANEYYFGLSDLAYVRSEFERVYRSFMPNEIWNMFSIDWLFPNIGAFNRSLLIRNDFYSRFSEELARLRSTEAEGGYQKEINDHLRYHWKTVSYYHKLLQYDLREYKQIYELNIMYINLLKFKKKFNKQNNKKSYYNFDFKFKFSLKNLISSFINNSYDFFLTSKQVCKSFFFKKFDIDSTTTSNIYLLNFFNKKQYNEMVYKRICIYELILKRESSFLQKLLSHPMRERLCLEDDLYRMFYNRYCTTVDDCFKNVLWCNDWFEDFIFNYEFESRSRLRNSISNLMTNFFNTNSRLCLRNLVTGAINSITSVDDLYNLCMKKNKDGDYVKYSKYGLLIDFNLFDFFKVLKFIFKGFFYYFLLFFYVNKEIRSQFYHIFIYDFILFIFLIPRYLFNFFLRIIFYFKRVFKLYFYFFSVLYCGKLLLAENKNEHYLVNFWVLLYLFLWYYIEVDISFPWLPQQHYYWCYLHGIDFDMYYSFFALPVPFIWFFVFMYYTMKVFFEAKLAMTKLEVAMDINFDSVAIIENAIMFKKILHGELTEQEIIDKLYDGSEDSEFAREMEAEKDESFEYKTRMVERFNSLKFSGLDEVLSKPDRMSYYTKASVPKTLRSEEMLEHMRDSNAIQVPNREWKKMGEDNEFSMFVAKVWFDENNLDETTVFKRNFDEFFYENPRKLSYQVQERFSILYSKTLTYDNLIDYQNFDVLNQHEEYDDITFTALNDIEFESIVKNRILLENFSKTKKHDSVFYE